MGWLPSPADGLVQEPRTLVTLVILSMEMREEYANLMDPGPTQNQYAHVCSYQLMSRVCLPLWEGGGGGNMIHIHQL